ncbi:N-acetylmuramoyl-L-alanine amidase [Bacillus sporothermodurans]|uniref:N-acetylmuramoyl-L-alanine amidase family protein n=1 Tax=Heyndrickxia sporothermodurans TaxID=46224 RepID=UPI00192C2A31|nr:N-acetylmuramoyl-L-alanine amidase [Heyndrickxia sporothermodurans]MBL5776984.1 N-acetylmuramoyl-L-alanine amidase [Heyndrickxia sporothermodurans]MBL5798511.1 N-acetylmuramoyl-L-alanine amidase [Heyndrickxia sporothermodurans]MBL5809428.1 N-acetylmuramoyl-L-alanine amidase [Heyndrickxia sporothermodurans]MBL5813063.1 N-acetylmuramoyl-L-alanine amidase [Heyndrickxia sporothermodurans]MBL5816487.1 N-acetylmuramoyl-L-alanine amidase [Heyndrickxia sporothermodurans]
MAKKLVLSYGHGADTANKAHSKFVMNKGKMYEEHTFNAKVGVKTKKIVEAHGITVLEVQPPNGSDVPLRTRTNKANSWGADLYYSIHANAGASSAKGVCAFYWSTSKSGKKLAELYAKFAKEAGLPLYHNGSYASVKGTWNDFHELRETAMTAVLTENGFMTNSEDFKRIFENAGNFHDVIAEIHAKVILSFFGVKYDPDKSGVKPTISKPSKPATSKPTEKPKKDIHRVKVDGKQVGAFGDEKNVIDAVEKALKGGAKKVNVEEV